MQLILLEGLKDYQFPQTRFQGSKSKLVDWILGSLQHLEYRTALDGFGGSGVVAYEFKKYGKQVFYNDYLKFNYFIGLALIENSRVTVAREELQNVLIQNRKQEYGTFIQDTFKNIYYYDEENRWLDIVIQNINRVSDKYKKAILLSALFQACIIKRPFNLFHRRNLYLRSADVKRNFGNKASWDKPFDYYLKKFVKEINAAVFDNGQNNVSLCYDIMTLDVKTDLAYFDPPYMNSEGVSVDYHSFYHFLEGLVDYERWHEKINKRTKNLALEKIPNPWNNPLLIKGAFDKLFAKFKDSIIIVSYRSDGIPSVEELKRLLRKYKRHVALRVYEGYKYVLSHKASDEILLIGY